MNIPGAQTLAKYRLTPEKYMQIYHSQNGLCACCHRAKPRVIDHDHSKRGAASFRALVCMACNSRIGKVESLKFGCSDSDYVDSCRYLRRHGREISCEGGCRGKGPAVRKTPAGRVSSAQIISEGRPFIPHSHR